MCLARPLRHFILAVEKFAIRTFRAVPRCPVQVPNPRPLRAGQRGHSAALSSEQRRVFPSQSRSGACGVLQDESIPPTLPPILALALGLASREHHRLGAPRAPGGAPCPFPAVRVFPGAWGPSPCPRFRKSVPLNDCHLLSRAGGGKHREDPSRRGAARCPHL